MKFACGAGLFLCIFLPTLAFAEPQSPPKPGAGSKSTPCELAKRKALGTFSSYEVVKGDTKTATKDSCVGAVFDRNLRGGRVDDINSYKCTGEKARVNLSTKGVLIVSQGDSAVPVGTCATTICEEGKACRPAKLTKGIGASDLALSPGPVAPTKPDQSKISELLAVRDKAQTEAERLQNEKGGFNAGVGIEPWTDEKEQALALATQKANNAQTEIGKLENAQLEIEKLANVQLEKDARVAAEREQLIATNDNLATLAREQIGLCQKIGGCDQLAIEGGRTDADIARNVRAEVSRINEEALKRVYPDSPVQPIGDDVTMVERQPGLPSEGNTFYPGGTPRAERIFYDNAGERFMEVRPDTGDVSLFKNGQTVPMRDDYGYISKEAVAEVLDTPGKFNAFWNEYVGDNVRNSPYSYKATFNDGEPTETHVTADLGQSMEKTIPYADYATLQNVGADVLGTRASMERIKAWTGGMYTIAEPSTIAEPGASWKYEVSPVPFEVITPISPAGQAKVVNAWEKVITTFPPSLYENADVVPQTIYTYSSIPGTLGARMGGFANYGDDLWPPNVWVDTRRGPDDYFYQSAYHELGHTFNPAFPADWGRRVYGDDWGRAYLGRSGYEALARGDGVDWPVGFANSYGYRGGLYEDQATVFEGMFKNYNAMQTAAQSDVTLGMKMQMVQDSFYKASGGMMDQKWWERLTPISPIYAVPRGNLTQKLMQGLNRLRMGR